MYTKVFQFEQYEQKNAIDVLNNSHILDVERYIQNKIISLLGGTKVIAQTLAVQNTVKTTLTPGPGSTSNNPPPIFQPINVNGFYKVTGQQEVTYYATTPWPGFSLGSGWTAIGIFGIVGNIQITSSSNTPGSTSVTSRSSERYNWKFTLQSDVDQFIEGVNHSIGATLYPPNQVPNPTSQRSGPVYGNFSVLEHVPQIIFSAPPPEGTAVGWYVVGLPTIGPCVITTISNSIARLMPIDSSIPANTDAPIFLKGSPTMIFEPKYSIQFVPANFYTSDLKNRKPVDVNPRIKSTYVPLRDLGTELADPPEEVHNYNDLKNKGFSSGSVLSLFAVGPQDKYMISHDVEKSQWKNKFKQHTNFSMYQKVIPLPSLTTYQGQTVMLELRPQDFGHLISNMYFTCTIPATSYTLNENLGRALISQVDFMVNETVIETLYDDWYIIRDQMFLDADEQKGMYSIAGGFNSGITGATSQTIVCPLELFFCRRHSHSNKGRERLRKPFFPMCAMWNQRLYLRFTFNPSCWWSSSPSTLDFTNPALITEEILLENEEKLYYQNTPLRFIVPRVKKESPTSFGAGTSQAVQELSANFPVQSMFWFFRNKNYESTTDSSGKPSGAYVNSRYSYGYSTSYIKTGVNVAFASSNNVPVNFVDPIGTAKITLNNVDISSTFQGSLYYAFKQPMEHGLSTPSRNIYMYSFGLSPSEYNQGGFLNFSKLNTQTSLLTLTFNPSYSTQITQGYQFYLFYYGYTVLEFERGFARLAFA